MVQFEMELPDEKIGWFAMVEENIHPEETLRIHFHGFLTKDKDGVNIITMELPEGLKLRSNSRIRRQEYEKRRFIGTLNDLPFWKKLHKGEKMIQVDFETRVMDFSGGVVTVILPDSYKKPEEETLADVYAEIKTKQESDPNSAHTFVAIDFETIQAIADNGKKYGHLPVSIGLVKVVNGEIIQRYQSLIKPPVKGSWQGVKSGLTDKDCQYAPSYMDIYSFIECFVHFSQLVAFGHGTEKGVLANMESYYRIEHTFLRANQPIAIHSKDFIDPLEMLKAKGEKDNSLEEACGRYGIRLEKAHDALCDAEATALLLLALSDSRKNSIPTTERVLPATKKSLPSSSYINRPKKDNSFFGKELPEEDVSNCDTPFFRKKICCTGFPVDVVDYVNEKMYYLGAIVKGNVTQSQTDMLILGPEAHRSTSKTSKAREWGKEIISLEEFKSMLSCCGELDDMINNL